MSNGNRKTPAKRNSRRAKHVDIGGMIATAGRCEEHQKIRYWSKADAKKDARRLSFGNLAAFQCGDTEFWHNGHLPRAVVSGEITRDDIFPPKPRSPHA
jgi:hypothetical protein